MGIGVAAEVWGAAADRQDDQPRAMRDACVREQRRAMLHQPHIEPLTMYAARLREHGSVEVPDFDPFDGGVDARVLFLFEKPGPMTSRNGGSGFISRNNDDPTAAATFQFMQVAGIPRKLTVTWNVIPWWNFTRKVTALELREGSTCVRELVELLPKLCAIVMVGHRACKAKPYLVTTGKELFTSWHPSPLVKAKFPDKWKAIPQEWRKVMEFVQTLSGE